MTEEFPGSDKKEYLTNTIEGAAINIPPTKEREKIFEAAVEAITKKGLEQMGRKYDAGGEHPKEYHTTHHPQTLEKRAERMADVFGLPARQRGESKMEIAWHDEEIDVTLPDPKVILAMVSRHRGAREGDQSHGAEGNEAKSAQHLEAEMIRANEQALGQEIFSKEEIETAKWAIDATYPSVSFGASFKEYPYYEQSIAQNPSLGKLLEELAALEKPITKGSLFFQPHLEKFLEEGKEIPKEVLLIALADLGAAGMAEKIEFNQGGDAEMRELYHNLRDPQTLERLLKGDEEADHTDRENVSGAFLSWLDSQSGFATFQALRFEKIVYLLKVHGQITPEEESGMRNLFSHFEDNIKGAIERAKTTREEFENIKSAGAEKEAFLYLARSMHYNI